MWLLNPYRFGGWTPAQISTALWLDAADASTITTVSGAVSEWRDKSGNGRHAAQVTAALSPTSSSLNGKNVVSFSQGQYFNITVDGYQSTFIVYSDASTGTYATPLGGIYNATGSTNGGGPFHGTESTSGLFSTQWTHSYTLNGANFLNGTSIGNGTSTARPASPSIFSFIASNQYTELNGLRRIGRDIGGAVERAISGVIAEIVLITGPATSTLRQQIEGYLAHKWGLTANLPSDHPYKSVAP